MAALKTDSLSGRAAAGAGGAALAARRLLLGLSYVGFVSLGLPDTVLGAAWPAIRAEFRLPLDAAGAALLVTTLGVVLSSTASQRIRARWGTGSVLIGSTGLAALALIASASGTSWGHLLTAAFAAGLGGGAIDACLNDYVARHHSARHMSWLHACWGVGAAIAPAVVATVLASGASWRVAYAALGGVEALLALSFVATRRLWQTAAAVSGGPGAASAAERTNGPIRASVLLFFCYGGLEAGAGLWAASLLVETRGTSPARAGLAVAAYWAALGTGRFVIGSRADALGPARVLHLAVWGGLAATCALAWPGSPAWFVTGALACLGFALAPIYPMAMHDTPRRFPGAAGARLVGYQVAAASAGVASLPWLLGFIARSTSLLLLPVALMILGLALVGLERLRRDHSTLP